MSASFKCDKSTSKGSVLAFGLSMLLVGIAGSLLLIQNGSNQISRQNMIRRNLRELQPVVDTMVGVARAASQHVPLGFQSGPDAEGETFGGGILYRYDTKILYLTGSSYGTWFEDPPVANGHGTSSCFLAIAKMPEHVDDQPQWIHSTQWDTDVQEACYGLHADRNPINLPAPYTGMVQEKVYLTGYSGVGGVLENLRDEAEFPSPQYALLMDIDVLKPVSEPQAEGAEHAFIDINLHGGRLMSDDSTIQYPVATAMDGEGYIFTASMRSYNKGPSEAFNAIQAAGGTIDPNVLPLGKGYGLFLQRFWYDTDHYNASTNQSRNRLDETETTILDTWRKPYSATKSTNTLSSDVIVSGMEYLGGVLLVVGSTAGKNVMGVFGSLGTTNQNRTKPDDEYDDNFDGFISKFDPETGDYININIDIPQNTSSQGPPVHERSSMRIESSDGKNDYITGICSSPADPQHFYVVGTTEGQIDVGIDEFVLGETHAFLMKVDLYTLEPMWTKQLGGSALEKAKVTGATCAVSPDGTSIYMGGMIYDGAALSLYDQQSHGGDDLFLLEVEPERGLLTFLRQIGTAGNEKLPTGGLTTDEQGNAILMGNTDGSFYRSRTADTDAEGGMDIFIMTVERGTGEYKSPLLEGGTVETEDPVDLTQEPTDSSESTPLPTSSPTEADEKIQVDPLDKMRDENVEETTDSSDDSTEPSSTETSMMIAVLGLIALLVVLGALVYNQSQSRGLPDIPTERTRVISYLHDFDVDDIDLKHSATGGWHCSYVNDLAHGINARDNAPVEELFGPHGRHKRRTNRHHYDPLQRSRNMEHTQEEDITFVDEPLEDRRRSSRLNGGSPSLFQGRRGVEQDSLL